MGESKEVPLNLAAMTKARSRRELELRRRVLERSSEAKKTYERANVGESRESSGGKVRRRWVIKRDVRVGGFIENDGLDNRR